MTYVVTRKAAADLVDIARFTAERWDDDQARVYITGIVEAFERLGLRPQSGAACPDLARGLRRMLHREHVIYFKRWRGGVLIARVLHKSQLPSRHL